MKEYIQVRTPDPEALKDQITRARGDKTMVAFAEAIKRSTPEISVSASTLSRACNVTDNKPVNMALLEAIALVSADNTVTVDTLAKANGMRLPEEAEEIDKKMTYLQWLREMARRIRMTIQGEISERGYSLQQLPGHGNGLTLNYYGEQRDKLFTRTYDFGYSISGLSPCSIWKFNVYAVEIPGDNNSQVALEAHVGYFLNRCLPVFASDNYEWELYENEKFSFVFVEEKLYRAFLDRIAQHNMKVNGLMTAILISTKDMRVIEETQLVRYDGETASSFFKAGAQANYDNSDEEIMAPLDFTEEDE